MLQGHSGRRRRRMNHGAFNRMQKEVSYPPCCFSLKCSDRSKGSYPNPVRPGRYALSCNFRHPPAALAASVSGPNPFSNEQGALLMTNIFVGNLSYQTTQEDLHAAFEQYGN